MGGGWSSLQGTRRLPSGRLLRVRRKQPHRWLPLTAPYLGATAIATLAFAIVLWRRGVRGRLLVAAAWIAFYGCALVVMMSAHNIEIVYNTVTHQRSVAGTPFVYDWRVYLASSVWRSAHGARRTRSTHGESGPTRSRSPTTSDAWYDRLGARPCRANHSNPGHLRLSPLRPEPHYGRSRARDFNVGSLGVTTL